MKNIAKQKTILWIARIAVITLAIVFTACPGDSGDPSDPVDPGIQPEKTLTGITVTKAPNKIEYFIHATLNPDGLEVTASYSDGSTKIIGINELTITGFDSSTAGEKTVTVYYGGRNAAFTVIVKNITLTKIEITAEPIRTEYWLNAILNLNGLEVTATFSDESTEIIDHNELTIDFDSSTDGEKTVTVTYGDKSDTFTVTVKNVTLTKIEITAEPTKTEYWMYEPINLDGLEVTGTLSDDSTEVFDNSELAISGFDPNTAGEQEITVSYGDESDTFTVTVTARIFTVTFNKNGGDSEASPQTKTVTQPATAVDSLPTPPARSNYSFTGWNTKTDGTGSVFDETSSVMESFDVYAQWDLLHLISVAEISEYLAGQTGSTGSIDNPVMLPLKIDLGNMAAGSDWQNILNAINTADKYVNLDLSACTMTGTEFNPDNTVLTGKDKIVEIALPNTATSIADGTWEPLNPTFNGFTNLTSFSGEGLTSIGVSAFAKCANLVQNELPIGLQSIGLSAFYECTKLVLTELPAGITDISDVVFDGCTSITQIELPAGTKRIGHGAFGDTSLTQIELPAGVTTIVDWAFHGCTSLTSVTFATGSNITSFGYNVFPEGSDGYGGSSLKTAYSNGGAGTYTRETNGSTWTKEP